jgi:hypothetical protein
MDFGNWNVSEKGIQWKGMGDFFIPGDQIIMERPGAPGGGEPMYEWILRATDQEWLSHDDLYDLNFAIVYAAAKLGLNFNYEIFDNTLEAQYEQFDAEEDEEDNY